MQTQSIIPSYYSQLTPTQFLSQASTVMQPQVQPMLPVYPTVPPQPVYRSEQNVSELCAFDIYTKGHTDLAISNLEKSLAGKQLNNSDVKTMVILGRLYREMKQYDNSVNMLQQALNLDNLYTVALFDPMPPNKIKFELGKTYFAMGKIKEAKACLQGEKVLYEIRKNGGFNKEDAKDYDELTHILNVQG